MSLYPPVVGAPASTIRKGRALNRWNRLRPGPRRFAHGRSQGRFGLYRTARPAFDASAAPLARAAAHSHPYADDEPSGQRLALVFARYLYTRVWWTKPLPRLLCRNAFGSGRDPDLSACETAQPAPPSLRD